MRIKEEFKRYGYFWLPSSPERKMPGILSISDGGNIELELDETIIDLTTNKSVNRIERIVGQVEKNGLVTLEGCKYQPIYCEFSGIRKSLVRVTTLFLGFGYKEDESILFKTFSFSVEGIDEWIGISGIKVDNQKVPTITYTPPAEIPFNLNNGIQLLVTFSHTIESLGFPNYKEALITQKILVSSEEREIGTFISIAHKITTLLCFAVDEIVCLDSVMATFNKLDEDGELRPVSIEIYYSSIPYLKDKAKINRNQILFNYGQIQYDAEKIINNWIDAYEKIEPSLNLYFSTKIGGQKYLEGQFLALAQGLEAYHKRWINSKDMHLKTRIEGIIEPFKDIIGTSEQREKITQDIVDTRNYLTHYTEAKKLKAASGRDLLFLCLKMELFFQLHFLQLLSFTEEQIKSCCK